MRRRTFLFLGRLEFASEPVRLHAYLVLSMKVLWDGILTALKWTIVS
jgi:hypothetical protein